MIFLSLQRYCLFRLSVSALDLYNSIIYKVQTVIPVYRFYLIVRILVQSYLIAFPIRKL